MLCCAEVPIPWSTSTRSLPTGIITCLSKIEALHGSYLAIAHPSSSACHHDNCCTGNSCGSEAASASASWHPSAVPPVDTAGQKGKKEASSDAGGRVDQIWRHSDAAATAALTMVRRVGEIERPGGGRTRVRVGLCSGEVCCAVIGADRPRFR
jgi:hypothetical protein